jgi:hypothetical protein
MVPLLERAAAQGKHVIVGWLGDSLLGPHPSEP